MTRVRVCLAEGAAQNFPTQAKNGIGWGTRLGWGNRIHFEESVRLG